MNMKSKIAIVDYGMGNLRSVVNAFTFVGARVKVTNNPKELAKAAGVVVPGQGAIRDCVANLHKLNLVKALREEVIQKHKPYLGICLGLQVLGDISFEGGEFECLGWIEGEVKLIKPKGLKVPHLGWNEVNILHSSPLFEGLSDKECFYFAHSYILWPNDKSVVVATTDYGEELPVAIHKKNVMAVQFHPEKSQGAGLKLIKNFINFVEKTAC